MKLFKDALPVIVGSFTQSWPQVAELNLSTRVQCLISTEISNDTIQALYLFCSSWLAYKKNMLAFILKINISNKAFIHWLLL